MAEDRESSSSLSSISSSSESSSQDLEDMCEQPLKKARYKRIINGSSDGTQEESSRHEKDFSKDPRETSSASCSRLNEDHRPAPRHSIYRWQTQQITRAVIDNSVNTVIEEMHHVHSFPLTIQEFIDTCFPTNRRDEHVEDEAVLMAIQSHGLHQKVRPYLCPFTEPFKQNSEPLNLHAPGSMYEFENDENTNMVVVNSSSSSESSSKLQESSLNNNSNLQSSNENKSSNLDKDNLPDKNTYDHDFLAQAVAVAIQKKGLGLCVSDENR